MTFAKVVGSMKPVTTHPHDSRQPTRKLRRQASWLVTLGALGVVFGDIGTSPLYALGEIFAHSEVPPTHDNVIGCVSLVLWALTLIVSLKYLTFVTRADNDGEGGVFALYALLHRFKKRGIGAFLLVLLLAAGMLFGDGVITPAISVLAAVEGLKSVTPGLQPWVVPITIGVLAGLFAFQRHGTAKVGGLFGPVIMLWFVAIAVIGAKQVIASPSILAAINPIHGVRFLAHAGVRVALLVLGGVMLSITGGEALYADMGHFGIAPIRRGWFAIVFPALIVAYLGQGAYLLQGNAIAGGNLFYSVAPQNFLIPLVLLATAATIIASQALISGAFSLAAQGAALGLFPRFKIVHTHHAHEGQIYAPFVNTVLFVGCALLVIEFGTSTALASAYGLAVSADMLTTSIAMAIVSILYWNWPIVGGVLLFGAFALLDSLFLAANSLKFFDGGYVPLTIGVVLFIVMVTWRWGRKATFAGYSSINTMSVRELIALKESASNLLDKNIILMVPKPIRTDSGRTPALLQLFWDRYQTLPKNLLFVEVVHRKVPYIYADRYEVTTLQRGADRERGSIISVAMSFGFMEDPNVEKALESLASHHEINLPREPSQWLVLVSQENLIGARRSGVLAVFRQKLFAFLRQVSQPGHYYYGLGDQVQLSVEIMPVKLHGRT